METEDDSASSDNERRALLSSSPRNRTSSTDEIKEGYSNFVSTYSFKDGPHQIQKTESMEEPAAIPLKGRYNKYFYGVVLVLLTLGKASLIPHFTALLASATMVTVAL